MIKLVRSNLNLIFKHPKGTWHHFARVNQIWCHNATENKTWITCSKKEYTNSFFGTYKLFSDWEKRELTASELAEIVADTLLQ